ncbi:Fc.00g024590.m01.CDS01 [Cosmosporella sp. VM-42]
MFPHFPQDMNPKHPNNQRLSNSSNSSNHSNHSSNSNNHNPDITNNGNNGNNGNSNDHSNPGYGNNSPNIPTNQNLNSSNNYHNPNYAINHNPNIPNIPNNRNNGNNGNILGGYSVVYAQNQNGNNCPVTPPATPAGFSGPWTGVPGHLQGPAGPQVQPQGPPQGPPVGYPPGPPQAGPSGAGQTATSAFNLRCPPPFAIAARPPFSIAVRPGPGPGNMSGPPPPKRPPYYTAQGGGPYSNVRPIKRLSRPTENFSNQVKSRLSTYTRTGQACDRCKIRKIRCDAAHQGCSQCIQQNIECWVTDRVTGRTERRGYRQELENEIKDKESIMKHIEAYLRSHGFVIRPLDAPMPTGASRDPNGNLLLESGEVWEKVDGLGWVKDGAAKRARSPSPSIPSLTMESRPEASHLGVGADSEPSSSIRGTRLSILGTTIDLNSFDAPDMDEPEFNADASPPVYNKSFHAMCRSLYGRNPRPDFPLPTRDQAYMFSGYYFQTVSNFLPILHEPSFMAILSRIYDQHDLKPDPNLTNAEWSVFHMVMATMYFQYSSRNFNPGTEERTHFNNLSNQHYHHALYGFQQLTTSPDLVAVQAMALIAGHTRAFPKPESSAYVANLALKRAIGMGLHRESRKRDETTNLRHELRKRIWWAILTVVVAISGRRGEPMPLTVDDFDVGFPEPIADELISEAGVDRTRKVECSYAVGIAGFKIIPLFMKMYSSIYAVRPDVRRYPHTVEKLEEEIRRWEVDLPRHLNLNFRGEAEANDQTHMRALYCRAFLLEFRLCLRHPSVALTEDKTMMADNMRICETTARELLQVQQQLDKLKSLDTTWYQISVHIASVFTILAACWQRRHETSSEDITELREEMNEFVKIFENTGLLLGSGPQISVEIGGIVERTIRAIEHDMRGKDEEPSQIETSVVKVEQRQLPNLQAVQEPPAESSSIRNHFQDPSIPSQATYPQLGYGNQAQSNVASTTFDPEATLLSTYPTALQATAALATSDAASSQQNMIPFAPQATQPVATPSGPDMMWQQRGNTWTDWTSNVMDGDQERFSANALMNLHQLGNGAGTRDTSTVPGSDATANGATNVMTGVSTGGQWPLMFYPDQPQSNGNN